MKRAMIMLAAIAAPLAAQSPASAPASAPTSDAAGPAKPVNTPAPKGTTTMLKSTTVTGDTSQPRQRYVTVFGNDECPKPGPDEVIVCARLPDEQRFRIPAQVRTSTNRVSPFETNRSLLLGDRTTNGGGAGSAIGSCSAIGPSGHVGCTLNQVDAWAKDRTDRADYSEPTPPQ